MQEDILDKLTPKVIALSTSCTLEVANEWLDYFKLVFKSYAINTPERIAAFLSQVGHESAGLSKLEENLSYSAEGLANTWPNRYAKKLQNGSYAKNSVGRYLPNTVALKLNRKPVGIANHCYADRMGNGNEASGDGWRYRGRGLKQLTGKDNYRRFSEYSGIDFVNKPELIQEKGYAIISACWFWEANKLSTYADNSDIKGLTKAINGGYNGYDIRLMLFKRALVEINKLRN